MIISTTIDNRILPFTVLAADVLFWGESSGSLVRRIDIDGISNANNWASGGATYGCTVDEETQKVFWTTFTPIEAVRKSDFDGSSTVTIISGETDPAGVDVDSTFMYFCRFNDSIIRRADKDDGSGVVTHISADNPRDLHIDLLNSHIYFVERNTSQVRRADLSDGGNNTLIIDKGSDLLMAIDVDPDNERIYYVNLTTEELRRVNFDGTGDTLIFDAGGGVPDNQNIQGMCADYQGGHLYWSDVTDDNIGQVELDGSNPNKTYVGTLGQEPRHIDVRYPQGSFFAKPNR